MVSNLIIDEARPITSLVIDYNQRFAIYVFGQSVQSDLLRQRLVLKHLR